MMFLLKNSSAELILDNRGVITSYSLCSSISETRPVYPVLFQDYSRLTPSCTLLNINSPITAIVQGSDWICFQKRIEQYLAFFRISLQNDGFDIIIHLDSIIAKNFRFGISIPFSELSECYSLNQKITTPLSFYCHFFHRLFNDQTLLDCPILTVKGSNSFLTSFCQHNANCQFFVYSVNGSTSVRMTTSTTTNTLGCFSVRFHDHLASPKVIYLETYPSADFHLNKWKTQIERLQSEYGLHVSYNSDGDSRIDDYTIRYNKPAENDVERFIALFDKELQRYNSDAFQTLGIKSVHLCSGMKVIGLNNFYVGGCNGWALLSNSNLEGHLFFNVDRANAETVHHEIFHFLEKVIDFSILSISDSEYLANLFARTVLNKPIYEDDKIEQNIKNLTQHYVIYSNIVQDLPGNDEKVSFVFLDRTRKEINFGDYPPKGVINVE